MENIITILGALFIFVLVLRKVLSIDTTQTKLDQTNEHLKNISEKLDVLVANSLKSQITKD